jgi:hypothetical protein
MDCNQLENYVVRRHWLCFIDPCAPQSNRTIKNVYSHSTETVSRKFNDVLDNVTLLVAQVIKLEDPQFRIVHLGYKKLGFSLVFL